MGTITGTDGPDTLTGTSGDDTIFGLGGNDTLNGGAGHDILVGGPGADILNGGPDSDIYQDTSANFNGDEITNLKMGDRIQITDLAFNGSSYNSDTWGLTANQLVYNHVGVAGAINIDNLGPGRLVFRPMSTGGLEFRLQQDAHNDFSGDGRSDILLRNDNGAIFDFLGTSNGGIVNNGGNTYTVVDNSWHVAGTGDFNGDGRVDILWRNDNGAIYDFLGTPNGGVVNNGDNSWMMVDNSWHVAGVADFNGDGRDDILLRNDAGTIIDYLAQPNGGFTNNSSNLFTTVGTDWHVAGTGDFNGDGLSDILWRNNNGAITDFLGTSTGGVVNNGDNLYTMVDNSWHVAATGDFNGDGHTDILWRNDNGAIFDFLGTATGAFTNNGDNSWMMLDNSWQIVGVGDYNGDGRDDLLLRNSAGTIIDYLSTSTGGFVDNSAHLTTAVDLSWHVQDPFL